jgi:hypothetical protein
VEEKSMNVRILGKISGISPNEVLVNSESLTGIGDEKKDILHGANRINPILISGRAAFLSLIKINLWGMATNLNLAWARSNANENFGTHQSYASVKQKWINAWYNLGGIFSNLQSAVNTGRYKKPFGIKLAPQSIKEAYQKATRSSISGMDGIGSVAATLTAAGTVIAALTGLLVGVMNLLGKDVPVEDASQYNIPEGFETVPGTQASGTQNQVSSKTFGYDGKSLLYGAIALVTIGALSYGFAPDSKKKKTE